MGSDRGKNPTGLRSPDSWPTVSVVLPIRNESATIQPLLSSVLEQDYPRDRMDVWVVDGESDDGTDEIVRRLANEDGRLHLLSNPDRIVPHAMNLGIESSKGEYVLRIDGHAQIPNDFVRRIAQLLKSQPNAGLAGGVVRPYSESPTGQSIAAAWSHPFGAGSAAYRTARKAGSVDTLAFGAYRRTALEKVGPFDVRLKRNQDDEMSFRLARADYLIWLDPTIESRYYSRGSLRRLFSQYYEYGYYKPMVIEKMGGAASLRHWVPPLFAACGIGGGLAGLFCPTIMMLWLIVAVAYGLAAWISAANAKEGFPQARGYVISAAFFIMHLSYGLGFLRSTFDRLLGRWRMKN